MKTLLHTLSLSLPLWLTLWVPVAFPASALAATPLASQGTTEQETAEPATPDIAGALEDAASEAASDPVGFAQKQLDRLKTWGVDEGPKLVLKALGFLGILLVFKVLAGILGRVTNRVLTTSRLAVPELLRNFAVNVTSKVTLLVGLMIAIAFIGVDIGPILAGIGVLGFVIGFALQDTLSNFAAGIMLLLYRPYDIGDVVSAGGVTGKVSSMNLVSTTLGTPDNQVVVVPNSKIWGDVITNVTANDTRRVDLTVGISYDDDIDKAESVIQGVLESQAQIHADPAPVVKLHNLGDSSVDFVVRVWADTSDYWAVYWDLTKGFKLAFDQEGISMPYPQRDVHLIREDSAQSA